MTAKEINQALFNGGEQAARAAIYLLENGVVTASFRCGGKFMYSVNKIKSEVEVPYDAVIFIESIINQLRVGNKRVYRLWTESDSDVCPTRVYSCRKDILQRRIRNYVQEDQAVYMRSIGYELDNPVKASKDEIEDFLKMGYANMFNRIKARYRLVEA